MSRYHFHLRIGPCRAIDSHGTECADRVEAVLAAMLLILDKCRTAAIRNHPARSASIEACDEAGILQFSIPFSRVVVVDDAPAWRRPAA
jgi:hypothetical protein